MAEELTVETGNAWVYHTVQTDESIVVKAPNSHDVRLPPGHAWCVTHRPTTPCPCGQYALEWQ
jgi:hypothetical protein